MQSRGKTLIVFAFAWPGPVNYILCKACLAGEAVLAQMPSAITTMLCLLRKPLWCLQTDNSKMGGWESGDGLE